MFAVAALQTIGTNAYAPPPSDAKNLEELSIPRCAMENGAANDADGDHSDHVIAINEDTSYVDGARLNDPMRKSMMEKAQNTLLDEAPPEATSSDCEETKAAEVCGRTEESLDIKPHQSLAGANTPDTYLIKPKPPTLSFHHGIYVRPTAYKILKDQDDKTPEGSTLFCELNQEDARKKKQDEKIKAFGSQEKLVKWFKEEATETEKQEYLDLFGQHTTSFRENPELLEKLGGYDELSAWIQEQLTAEGRKSTFEEWGEVKPAPAHYPLPHLRGMRGVFTTKAIPAHFKIDIYDGVYTLSGAQEYFQTTYTLLQKGLMLKYQDGKPVHEKFSEETYKDVQFLMDNHQKDTTAHQVWKTVCQAKTPTDGESCYMRGIQFDGMNLSVDPWPLTDVSSLINASCACSDPSHHIFACFAQQNTSCVAVKIKGFVPVIVTYALRKISAGEQLFISYGTTYWKGDESRKALAARGIDLNLLKASALKKADEPVPEETKLLTDHTFTGPWKTAEGWGLGKVEGLSNTDCPPKDTSSEEVLA